MSLKKLATRHLGGQEGEMVKLYIIALAAALVLFMAGGALAADNACSSCHPEKTQGRSVHKAVKDACATCHIGVNAETVPHKIVGPPKGLPRTGAKLCFSCHDEKHFSGGRGVHGPVAEGDCAACHDPHSSQTDHLLVSNDVCFDCHGRSSFMGKNVVHAPVKAGQCSTCHNPHKSPNRHLLADMAPRLCYRCHEESSMYTAAEHVPIRLGMCSTCHEIHQSDFAKLIRESKADLCKSCHEGEAAVERVGKSIPVNAGAAAHF